jgi:hypothetical protein
LWIEIACENAAIRHTSNVCKLLLGVERFYLSLVLYVL